MAKVGDGLHLAFKAVPKTTVTEGQRARMISDQRHRTRFLKDNSDWLD
jgi:hypothetical protein